MRFCPLCCMRTPHALPNSKGSNTRAHTLMLARPVQGMSHSTNTGTAYTSCRQYNSKWRRSCFSSCERWLMSENGLQGCTGAAMDVVAEATPSESSHKDRSVLTLRLITKQPSFPAIGRTLLLDPRVGRTFKAGRLPETDLHVFSLRHPRVVSREHALFTFDPVEVSETRGEPCCLCCWTLS